MKVPDLKLTVDNNGNNVCALWLRLSEMQSKSCLSIHDTIRAAHQTNLLGAMACEEWLQRSVKGSIAKSGSCPKHLDSTCTATHHNMESTFCNLLMRR